MLLATIVFGLLLAGSIGYCLLTFFAVQSYLGQTGTTSQKLPPISVLKPLAGLDEGLEENVRSFFEQDYPDFEILFAARDMDDPAVETIAGLQKQFPARISRLIITGEPLYPNAKVFSLERMLAEAQHDLLVMSDSDIRVGPEFLKSVAAEFADPKIGLATCPYRAVAGASFWSKLEAVGMNTEFLAGLLVARTILGVKFAVGPTLVARKSALAKIGGLKNFKDYLAEDFVFGKSAAEAGLGVILSRNIVEHHIGSESWPRNASHRLRWVRSTRRSRPLGYVGQVFTYPVPIALIFWAVAPSYWLVSLAAAAFRGLAAWSTSRRVLGVSPQWHLMIFQDFLSFGFWIAGFFGSTIVWRGRRYELHSDGRLELRSPTD